MEINVISFSGLSFRHSQALIEFTSYDVETVYEVDFKSFRWIQKSFSTKLIWN